MSFPHTFRLYDVELGSLKNMAVTKLHKGVGSVQFLWCPWQPLRNVQICILMFSYWKSTSVWR